MAPQATMITILAKMDTFVELDLKPKRVQNFVESMNTVLLESLPLAQQVPIPLFRVSLSKKSALNAHQEASALPTLPQSLIALLVTTAQDLTLSTQLPFLKTSVKLEPTVRVATFSRSNVSQELINLLVVNPHVSLAPVAIIAQKVV